MYNQRRQIDTSIVFTNRSGGIGSSADKPKTLLQHVFHHLKTQVDTDQLIPLANELFSGKEGTKIATEEEGYRAYLEVMRHDMERKSSTTQRILQDDLQVIDGALRDSILGDFHYIIHGLDVMNHRQGAAGAVHVIEEDEDDDNISIADADDEDVQQEQQQKRRKRTYTLYKADELYDYFGTPSS